MKINNDIGYTKIFRFLFFLLFVGPPTASAQRAFVADGVFDLRRANPDEDRIALNGNWHFYPSALLDPEALQHHTPSTLLVPSLWNDHAEMKNTGAGTYALTVILRDTGLWALEVPQLYNSYLLFINGKLIARNGTPSTAKDSTIPQWKPQSVIFNASDTVRIVLQLSNHHHFKGGIREPIYLGRADVITGHFKKAMFGVGLEVIVLLLLTGFFLYLFFVAEKGRVTLYFALLCLSWATREMFSDLYPINALLPSINWFWLLRIEYMTLFLIPAFGILFLSNLFRELSSDLFKYLVVIVNAVYVIFSLVTPVIVFTRWLPLYLGTTVVVLIYAAVMIVRAMMQERTGAWFLIAGLILSIIAIGYDLIAYRGILENHIMIGSLFYMLIFVSSAIGLLQHLRIIRSDDNSDILRYQDLYKK